ncbi:MAG: FtsQ-type POTRA domain-containing protein [Dehalococcoidia bacterium]|nr:FtsQ-type POTRA domain-containing protein [Dehalococcoidia bacterium]MYK25493.1 FtsQ-type POTRA domain-containing protein [Dehalococcoidia bacterium]
MIRKHDQPKPRRQPNRIVRRKRPAPAQTPKQAAARKVGQAVGQRKRRVGTHVAAIGRRGRSWMRARWLPITAAVLFLGVVGAGAWAWHSPTLQVREVEVDGAMATRESEILEQVDFWGERMFTADLDGAADAIAALPLVASVEITREWPGTVHITVREREPWGSWEQAGLRYTIDREGYVLGHGAPPADSTTIVSNESYSLRAGDRVDYHAVDATAAIKEQIEQALGTRAIEFTYSPGEGIRVRTEDGQTALLGDSSSIAYKLAVWARVAEEALARDITYSTIDLRFGDRPVLR